MKQNKQVQDEKMSVARVSLLANGLVIGIVLFVVAQTFHLTPVESSQSDGISGNLLRKSIVFDLKTPKVFYCPQEKPFESDKMIVKARPLDKLCEFNGEPKPKGASSDCYNDIDESEFACDEKKRFMIRLDLAGEFDEAIQNNQKHLDTELDYVISKGTSNGKKKTSPGNKKY